jgi:uncharacterized protein DUF4238
MAAHESRRHHFVPKLLLRPWLIEDKPRQLHLRGYFWDTRRASLWCKRRGLDSFCCQIDLLSLRSHSLGRDAIERVFFAEIDTKGADACDLLIEAGPKSLNSDQRCDFARLLMSLDIRRPSTVAKVRETGTTGFVDGLNNDPEILAAMEQMGITETPSSFYEQQSGTFLEDRALTMVQGLVDNPQVAGRLVNAFWHVRRLSADDQSLVLSDRPLIRLRGYDHPGGAWILPLTPRVVFIAVNHPANLQRILNATSNRLVRYINVASARQAERFVFCVDTVHEWWLPKYLRPRSS